MMSKTRQFLMVLFAVAFSCGAAVMKPTELRCEYMRNPEGIDALKPRLSWVVEPSWRSTRGERQTAWQILVASTRDGLWKETGDLWDSGKVQSGDLAFVEYGGKPLRSGQECFWKVRVWDHQGMRSDWSQPARWTMGLLRPEEWLGKWIGRDEEEIEELYEGFWIWFPAGNPEKSAAIGKAYFRREFELPEGRAVISARWYVAGDNRYVTYLNGRKLGEGGGFKAVDAYDVAGLLKARDNTLATMVENAGSEPNPAGFTGRLIVEFDSGDPLVIETDDRWLATVEEFKDWEQPDFDDSIWLKARNLGKAGMQPWGDVSMPEDRRLPARYLRKEFAAEKKIRRTTVWYSGLGLSELYINGKKVGSNVLSPGLTEYDKRMFYVTHDVTRFVHQGSNAVGVILGNGRYYAPRARSPVETRTYGFPKLLFQMRVEHTDGTSLTIVSDDTWSLSVDGPIRANNEYDGEEYDANREFGPWAEPGFRGLKWTAASLVNAPGGVLAAQMTPPIRVVETLKPISLTEPSPGVFIFDMGQNMVGWCRLRVSGPKGTEIKLRHAETLKPDGTLYMDNLRGARVTDLYVMKGTGREVYEPRFTYHGFRYVEVTGFPGKPSLNSIEGRVVHDDLEWTGEFACSNPLLNRIYSNIVWGVRGNYRSIPTDCPQRDERQGWLGDRSAESRGEAYIFNTATLYSKWLRDMADAQKPNGSVPDVCPSYWPFYNDNVTWPSSIVMIPGALYDQFGDLRVVREIYPSAKKWLLHMRGYVTNGIIARDNYGDWCVPPEDPKLIHSNDPARKTDPALLATAYLFHDAQLMERYAMLLGLGNDAKEFGALSEELRAGLNRNFYDREKGFYANGSQTSSVLPLAFGLVPEGGREKLFAHLVEKISVQSDNHIGTGLIGAQWLMRVLTEHGRGDLAYTIAGQRTYPSWGYMVERGATTVWELWNGDTADPAMNSGNHVMLVGDLLIWMFENLAGIKPDPERPGFKHIIMRPEMPEGLDFVQARHKTPYGPVVSEWTRSQQNFRWQVRVPVNSVATLHIPTDSTVNVRESGRTLNVAKGVRVLGPRDGRIVVEVVSGRYVFDVTPRQ
jgi:alpha-L-rhamnosidase